VEEVDGALVEVDGCEGAHGLGSGAVFVVPCGAAGGGGAELPVINIHTLRIVRIKQRTLVVA